MKGPLIPRHVHNEAIAAADGACCIKHCHLPAEAVEVIDRSRPVETWNVRALCNKHARRHAEAGMPTVSSVRFSRGDVD